VKNDEKRNETKATEDGSGEGAPLGGEVTAVPQGKPFSQLVDEFLEKVRQAPPIPGDNRNQLSRFLGNLDFGNLNWEKDERRAREIAMVQLLHAIHNELQEERRARELLAETVRAHEKQLSRYRTGTPGRPGSQHLVLDEFKRRAAKGRHEPTLAQESVVLSKWLAQVHPKAHPMKPRSVENAIRVQYRRAWDKKPKRTRRKR